MPIPTQKIFFIKFVNFGLKKPHHFTTNLGENRIENVYEMELYIIFYQL